jgi:hypothetical protein
MDVQFILVVPHQLHGKIVTIPSFGSLCYGLPPDVAQKIVRLIETMLLRYKV